MKTEKIDRLLSALGRPVQAYTEQAAAGAQRGAKPAGADEDAVKLDPSLRGKSEESDQSQRQAKITRLAAQVQDGSYRPSSEGIAVALIKELNIG